jgi:FtsP/CotA-like multicopper oxidase with cupredoxin domain
LSPPLFTPRWPLLRPGAPVALAAALAVLSPLAPAAPAAAQSNVVQTDAGPCDLAPPPRAAAGLGAGEQGELLPSVEIPEPADARIARLKASALFDAPAESWVDPPVLEGDKAIDLRVAYAKHKIYGKDANLRSYLLADGSSPLPAPTFRFRAQSPASDRHLKVRLRNILPCNGGKPGDPACPSPPKCKFHGHEHPDPNNPANFRLNDTNLHVHGLHVSPQPPQDDVLLTVEPGCDYSVDVRIPKDHVPGTAWYHPHQHGSTALQLASGMAGALIIEGDIDRVPEVQAAKERIFVFQQISFSPASGTSEVFKDLDRNWKELGINKTGLTLINGQVKPRIVMPRRAVERWRFINAGFFEVLPIRLAGDKPLPASQLHVIAVDGITLPRRRPVERVDLAPGNRADVMVQFDQPGTYYLYKSESMRQEGVLDAAQILAQVDVLAETREMKLPDLLPGTPAPIDETAAKPRPALYFSARRDEALKRFRFIVNGRDFDPMRVDQTLKLGATEEWTVFNCTDQDHPFHIHVNPFQVSEYTVPDGNGGVRPVRIGDPKQRPWHDTFLIPKGQKNNQTGVITPGYFKLLTHYEDFDGRFVLHCHILTHEDQGMMQLVDIVK